MRYSFCVCLLLRMRVRGCLLADAVRSKTGTLACISALVSGDRLHVACVRFGVCADRTRPFVQRRKQPAVLVLSWI